MKCWKCETEMIWGGDHDIEDSESFEIVSNFSCPGCGSQVDFYHSKDEID